MEDDADVSPAMDAQIPARQSREILSEDFKAAGRRVIEPGDQIEKRGLSGSGGAAQRDELTLWNVERNTIKRADNNPTHLIGLLEITGA